MGEASDLFRHKDISQFSPWFSSHSCPSRPIISHFRISTFASRS